MKTLPERLREKARKEGLGVDGLRRRLQLGGGTFYNLLRGEMPRTMRVVEKLEAGGVRVRDLLVG